MSHFHLLWDVPIFWWHAWGAVVLPLIEDLGILGILFAIFTFLVRYSELRRKKKSHADAVRESKEYFKDNVWTPLKTYFYLFLILGFAIGPYELFQRDEQRLADYKSLKSRVEDLRNQNDKLTAQVQQLTPKPEQPDSLRRRTMKLADEVKKYVVTREQSPNRPPVAIPNSNNPNPSEEEKKAMERYHKYEQDTWDYYMSHYRAQMVGIIREYNAKGVQTGYLESSVNQSIPLIFFPGMVGDEGPADELYQFRELAYHVDGNDHLIVF